MVSVIRLFATGIFIVALVIHIVAYSTNYWIHAKLDPKGIGEMMNLNGFTGGDGSAQPGEESMDAGPGSMDSGVGGLDSMGSALMAGGMEISMGLWKYCMSAMHMTKCQDSKAEERPDWWKAVQALGILTMLTAAVAIVLMVYSIIGESKGDRARLLPYFIAALCLVAGLLLIVAVIIYGSKFSEMMNDTRKMGLDSIFVKNLEDNTSLSWSFALDTVSAVLMIITSVLIAVLEIRGCNSSLYGGNLNRAV